VVEGDHSVVAAEARKLPHLASQFGDNEWYAPSDYLEAARSVMGEIDLAPASNPVANQVVQATVYYSEQDDGLEAHGLLFADDKFDLIHRQVANNFPTLPRCATEQNTHLRLHTSVGMICSTSG
jgi:hypothetical protein